MTLALATRGYLCFGAPTVYPCGPGPSLVSAAELSPAGEAAVVQDVPPPSGEGESLVPEIVGATAPPADPADPRPQTVSAVDLVPEITQAEEDD